MSHPLEAEPSRRDTRRSKRSERRGPFAVALALAIAAALSAQSGCRGDSGGQPSLVLITTDRLAADRLECFGGPRGVGASLCALGRDGTLYAWALSPGRTEASSAATLLTGLPEHAHGVDGRGFSFLADRHQTIAEDLARAEYSTAAFVTRPALNHSRRLDQGFDVYLDHSLAGDDPGESLSISLSEAVQEWIATAPAPFFVWIHAGGADAVDELDRLVARLTGVLDETRAGPGILFTALRGEESQRTSPAAGIEWRAVRVPMIWRPPRTEGGAPAASTIARALVGLPDAAPTLRAAAGIASPEDEASLLAMRSASTPTVEGAGAGAEDAARYLLIEGPERGREVGIASGPYLYVRSQAPGDGSGRPETPEALQTLGPRFLAISLAEPGSAPSAALDPGPWRHDVLGTTSPVPRLEVHLARQLAARGAAP